jgi:hypothetical protein
MRIDILLKELQNIGNIHNFEPLASLEMLGIHRAYLDELSPIAASNESRTSLERLGERVKNTNPQLKY